MTGSILISFFIVLAIGLAFSVWVSCKPDRIDTSRYRCGCLRIPTTDKPVEVFS